MRGRIVRYESYDFEKIFFDVVYFSSGDDRLTKGEARENGTRSFHWRSLWQFFQKYEFTNSLKLNTIDRRKNALLFYLNLKFQ